VLEALTERAEADHLKAAGIIGGDELRSMPVIVRSRRRLAWLSINIGLNILAASVIAAYEDTLTAVIALAVFLPIVSDMSGCSGNQAVAVSMRELTLGAARTEDVMRVWRKEAIVGMINGIALGALLGIAAWAWKGNPVLGLVVGAALAANTVVEARSRRCLGSAPDDGHRYVRLLSAAKYGQHGSADAELIFLWPPNGAHFVRPDG
jgi:magnesium transporter